MEEKPEYITEAMELLEEHAAARIESPRVVRELTDDGLREYKVWGWVKVSAKFIAHIKKLKGAKLAIWQTIALSIDEVGECNLSVNDIVKLTDYSRSEVFESLKELDEMGYLSVVRQSGRKSMYIPEFAARGSSSPSDQSRKTTSPVPSLASANNQSSPSEENAAHSIKSIKRVNTDVPENMPLDWYIQHGLPVPEKLTEQNQIEAEATSEFESAMGFGQLPWDSVSQWQTFKKWVVRTYQSEPQAFRQYAEWRRGKGKFTAMSNKQIRQSPAQFIDTGYPDFIAHNTMYNGGGNSPKPL